MPVQSAMYLDHFYGRDAAVWEDVWDRMGQDEVF